MSEFEAAAMVEAMSVDDDGFEARLAGAACISDAVAAGAKDMEGVDAANEENINVQQPGRDPRDIGLEPMVGTTCSTSSGAATDNHSNFAVAAKIAVDSIRCTSSHMSGARRAMYCESGNALWLYRHLLFELHTVVCGELYQSVAFVVEAVRRAERSFLLLRCRPLVGGWERV